MIYKHYVRIVGYKLAIATYLIICQFVFYNSNFLRIASLYLIIMRQSQLRFYVYMYKINQTNKQWIYGHWWTTDEEWALHKSVVKGVRL